MLVGLLGALIGGSMLSLTVTILFLLEKRTATKKSDKLTSDLIDVLKNQKLAQSITQVGSAANKYN